MYKNNKLTRAGMEQVIKSGGSVLHNGQIYNNIATLPSDADLAKGDPAAEKSAEDALRKELADTQNRLKALQDQQAQTKRSTEDEARKNAPPAPATIPMPK